MANKFAWGLVLAGAVSAGGIGIFQAVSENFVTSIPAATITNQEYERALVDAMEVNRRIHAQQKAEDEKREVKVNTDNSTYVAKADEMDQYFRERGLAYAEAARERNGW